MRRKILFVVLATIFLATVSFANAQQTKKVPRIGYLFTGLLTPKEFQEALRDIGYVEGQNVAMEYRAAEGKEDRLPELAAELVRLKVDIIVAPGTAAQAAKKATTTVPIVYIGGGDPVAMGLVSSLARPGGNVTGVATLSQEITGKRLELLKESFPKVSRVAVLVRTGSGSAASWLKETEAAAKMLGLHLRSLEVRSPNDFDTAFQAGIRERVEALVELPNPLFHGNRSRIVEFATKNRLPTIFHSTDFVDAGGLMCYGENNAVSYRRAATYVDKILKGAKPADLPVEQPTKFEFIINLKTAKQIGLTIPPNVLARADKVIR